MEADEYAEKETITIHGIDIDIVHHGYQDALGTVENVTEVILNGVSLGYCNSNGNTWKICDEIGLPVYDQGFSNQRATTMQIVKYAVVRSIDAEKAVNAWEGKI